MFFGLSTAFAHVRCIFVDAQWFSLFSMNQRCSCKCVLPFFATFKVFLDFAWLSAVVPGSPRLSLVFIVCAGRARRSSPVFPGFLCIFGPICEFLNIVFVVAFRATCATCSEKALRFCCVCYNISFVVNFNIRGSAGSQQLRRGSPRPRYWPACVGGASKATQRRWRPRRRRFACVKAPAWRRECAWIVRVARERVAEATGRRLRQGEGDGAPYFVGKGRRPC